MTKLDISNNEIESVPEEIGTQQVSQNLIRLKRVPLNVVCQQFAPKLIDLYRC